MRGLPEQKDTNGGEECCVAIGSYSGNRCGVLGDDNGVVVIVKPSNSNSLIRMCVKELSP